MEKESAWRWLNGSCNNKKGFGENGNKIQYEI